MVIDYKPLWHLLLDRNMSKTELRIKADISTRQLAKMGKNDDVSTETLRKICTALDCDLSEIISVSRNVEKDATQ